jgi:hypothetical protein
MIAILRFLISPADHSESHSSIGRKSLWSNPASAAEFTCPTCCSTSSPATKYTPLSQRNHRQHRTSLLPPFPDVLSATLKSP